MFLACGEHTEGYHISIKHDTQWVEKQYISNPIYNYKKSVQLLLVLSVYYL